MAGYRWSNTDRRVAHGTQIYTGSSTNRMETSSLISNAQGYKGGTNGYASLIA
jgi:hypothetical protein